MRNRVHRVRKKQESAMAIQGLRNWFKVNRETEYPRTNQTQMPMAAKSLNQPEGNGSLD